MKINLEDYCLPDDVVLLKSRHKWDVLEELVAYAVRKCEVSGETFLSLLRDREDLSLTALESGIAVPHVRIDGLPASIVLLGVCPQGIDDYRCHDDTAVKLLIFIAVPYEKPATYLKILSDIAHRIYVSGLNNADFSKGVATEDIYRLLARS